MNQNINSLESISDCDAILQIANGIKGDVERKLAVATHEQARLTNSASGLDQKIDWVTNDIQLLNDEIATMPEGREKEAAITRRMRLELNLRVYNQGIDNYGLVALLEADLDVDRYTGTMDRINAFIAEVEAKKAQLPAAA